MAAKFVTIANEPRPTVCRVLVVEDERIVARDLASTLTELGYTVISTVATGEDAVQRAREQKPDIILMDVRLEGELDGVQATEQIRAERDVPIIFLTAHSDEETLRRAKGTEPFGYLVKPFKAAELYCAIEIALHKHELETRLREREQWLATTLSSIGDGVVATDHAQRIKFLNPTAEALTGWKNDEAFGRGIDDVLKLVSDKDLSPIESPVRRALSERIVATLPEDAVLISKSGESVPVDDAATPIIDDRGQLIGGVMVFRDVSEKRTAEAQIRRLNAELEQKVVERTEQLEAANRELEAFSYSVAHDLRAPLRGISGFSQALIEDHAANLGPEGLDHLQRVLGGAERMSQLIDDLLRLSRIASAGFHREHVDLSRLGRSVVNALQAADRERRVVVTIPDGLTVEGDERLLRIVLENLLGNAWKFTAKAPTAAIELGALEKSGRTVHFVRDNGVGFPPALAQKLFVVFQRLHSTSEFEGTGVGLTIVRRIIHRHGGYTWGEGAVGAGATFYFVV